MSKSSSEIIYLNNIIIIQFFNIIPYTYRKDNINKDFYNIDLIMDSIKKYNLLISTILQ